MKNKPNYNKKSHLPALIYAVFWLLSVGLFWLVGRTSGSVTMFYSILVQYILFPILTFVVSLWTAFKNSWKTRHWGLAILLGFAYSTIWLFTFGLANTISSGNWNLPLMKDILFGGMISAVGLVVGRGLCFLKNRFPRR